MSHDFLSALPLAVSLFQLFAFVFSGINSKCGHLGEWEKGRCEARAKGKLSNVSKVGGTRKGRGVIFTRKWFLQFWGSQKLIVNVHRCRQNAGVHIAHSSGFAT